MDAPTHAHRPHRMGNANHARARTGGRRPRWPKDLLERVYTKSRGKCHHCGVDLPWDRTGGARRAWHVDHHPVAYRDIEGQVLWGVRDPLDERNLVASCPPCNLSHEHEHDVCCGHTQCRCRRDWVRSAATALFTASAAALSFYVGTVVGDANHASSSSSSHPSSSYPSCICPCPCD